MCQYIAPDFLLKAAYKATGKSPQALQKQLMMSADLRTARRAVIDPNPSACDMITHDANQKTDLPGQLTLTNDIPFTGSVRVSVNEAHKNAGIVRKFFRACLNSNSIDNEGIDIISSAEYGDGYDNAFATEHEGKPIMVYGTGHLFKRFTLALDVAAHEIGHQRVAKFAGLRYVCIPAPWKMLMPVPGAQNESYADAYGIACKQWFTGDTKNWLMGDTIIGEQLAQEGYRAIRDMRHPGTAYPGDPQPGHLDDYVMLAPIPQRDLGGVHINSGIPNLAFVLFSEISGKPSFEQPIRIWDHALPQLGQFASFNDFVKALLLTCQREERTLQGALKEALHEVGLYD